MKRGKKYTEKAKLVERATLYDTEDAIKLVQETAGAKFDETVEAHIRLGVDGRHADQQVRGAVVLPHGTGKTVRVLVFAKGDKVKEAEAEGIKLLKEAKADKSVLALKSFEAFKEAANGQATKIIIPSEIQNLASTLISVSEVIKKD